MKQLAQRIVLILNALAAAALLISYLAPLVNPARFVVPALFGLAYPYLLIINLVFVFYWLIYLKKAILISLLAILLGWNHLNNLLPLVPGKKAIPEEASYPALFKVLSYNVRGFDRYHWNRDPDARNQILELVKKEEPDILCFQEYFVSPQSGEGGELRQKLDYLPHSAVYFTSDPSNRSGMGIATYSNFPILKRSRIPFNSTFNSAMYTDLQVGKDTIRVFNIHLQSIRFHQAEYAFMDTVRLTYSSDQMKEIRNIGSRLKAAFSLRAQQASVIANYIRESPYPVIIMGDFNDTPHSYAYRKIRRGLNDAFRKAGKGFGNTYAGELPSFRIDHIFYQDPLVPYRFRRIRIEFSDHYPVTTWFYLPTPVNSQ